MKASIQGNLTKKAIKDAVDYALAGVDKVGGELYDSAFPSFENEELKNLFKAAFLLEVQERLNKDYERK